MAVGDCIERSDGSVSAGQAASLSRPARPERGSRGDHGQCSVPDDACISGWDITTDVPLRAYAAGCATYRAVNERMAGSRPWSSAMSGRSGRASLEAPGAAEDEDSPGCYLLFVGVQPAPVGGLGDLVGAFTSETVARHAFRQLRLHKCSVRRWAQLALVDGHYGIRPLSWFRIGATPARTPVTLVRPETLIKPQTDGGVMQMATRRRHPLRRIEVLIGDT